MDTRLWGPPAWEFLHTISFNYPEEPTSSDKKNMSLFLKSLSKVLPCEWCRKHFTQTLKDKPPQLNSRNDFSRWFVDVHNLVNKRLNKPQYSFQNVQKKYENHRGQCTKKATAVLNSKCSKVCSSKNLSITVAIFVLLILLIILLIIFIVCQNNKHV